jgi:hypothetical protein
MNKLIASIGMVAVGASGMQAASAAPQPAKPWSVSATLRGFFDDNINTAPSSGVRQKVGSWGVEISPGFGLNWVQDTTSLSLGYRYSLKEYEERAPGFNKTDQTHIFDAALNHAFSDRYRIALSDSFVLGNEPDLIRAQNTEDTFFRTENTIRNYGSIIFNAELTPILGLELGYDNAFYDYHQNRGNSSLPDFPPFIVTPTLSGLLDRDENRAHVNANFHVMPDTTVYVGYKYGQTVYTGNEDIAVLGDGTVLTSDQRNVRSHYGYVGAKHTFLPNLSGSVEVGGEYSDYYNSPNDETAANPYVQAQLTYNYAPESFVQLGVSHQRSATDIIAPAGANDYTKDAETTVVFGRIYHRIAPRLFANINGTLQNSSFEGGSVDGDAEGLYQLGLELDYKFNQFLAAQVGYNYDKLDSDLANRSFSRNRVYFGLTASY